MVVDENGDVPCESGGIGRRTRLRIWRVKPWGFESPLSHQQLVVTRSLSPSSFVPDFAATNPLGLFPCFRESPLACVLLRTNPFLLRHN